MANIIKHFLYNLKRRRDIKRIPIIKAMYLVSDSTQALATLTDPGWHDMFWISFRLTPLLSNPLVLDKLYSDDFWIGSEKKITEYETLLPVDFTIAMQSEGGKGDDFVCTSGIGNRPERVILRGPYPVEH